MRQVVRAKKLYLHIKKTIPTFEKKKKKKKEERLPKLDT